MSKKIKIFLIVLASIFALAGIGIWYAATHVDPAQITGLLSSSVKESTGRDLKISGPVKLSLFPGVAVHAEKVSLSNASWASQPEMIVVEEIALTVKLLPLFGGRIEVDSITLNGANLALQTNQAGTGNWVMTAPVSASSNSNPNQSQSQNQSASSGDSTISFENFNIDNAQITYESAGASKKAYQISHLSLTRSGDKSVIELDAKSPKQTLVVKGQVTPIPKIMKDWGISPLKVELDLNVTFNGKTLSLQGGIDKTPNSLTQLDLTLKSAAFDLEPLAGGAALASSNGQVPTLPAKSSSSSRYVFSDDPLPFRMLPQANGRLNINISELSLPGYAPLKNVNGVVQFKGDEIDINQLTFQLGSGLANLQGNISKFQGASPALVMKGFAHNFTLENVLLNAHSGSKVSGGEMKVAFDLKGSGLSLHQILARTTGKLQISVGQAQIASTFLNSGGDFVITLVDAINPLRKKNPETTLQCAVAYLPITQGQVNIDNSVGVQTDRLNVFLAGTINLGSEAVNLNIYPSEKSGLTTGLDLANLVKIQGTLSQPKAAISGQGVLNSAVSIGLGFLTGGATIVAENAKSLANKEQPCSTALHPWSNIYPGAN